MDACRADNGEIMGWTPAARINNPRGRRPTERRERPRAGRRNNICRSSVAVHRRDPERPAARVRFPLSRAAGAEAVRSPLKNKRRHDDHVNVAPHPSSITARSDESYIDKDLAFRDDRCTAANVRAPPPRRGCAIRPLKPPHGERRGAEGNRRLRFPRARPARAGARLHPEPRPWRSPCHGAAARGAPSADSTDHRGRDPSPTGRATLRR